MQYQADICYRAAILLPFLSMGLIVFFGKGSFSSILNYITYVSSNFTLTLQVVQKNILSVHGGVEQEIWRHASPSWSQKVITGPTQCDQANSQLTSQDTS